MTNLKLKTLINLKNNLFERLPMRPKTNKLSFKQVVASLPPLRVLTVDTKLPKYFDMMWDAKTGRDILTTELCRDPKVIAALRENGFDGNLNIPSQDEQE